MEREARIICCVHQLLGSGVFLESPRLWRRSLRAGFIHCLQCASRVEATSKNISGYGNRKAAAATRAKKARISRHDGMVTNPAVRLFSTGSLVLDAGTKLWSRCRHPGAQATRERDCEHHQELVQGESHELPELLRSLETDVDNKRRVSNLQPPEAHRWSSHRSLYWSRIPSW
jgi:hypothetical protein